MRQLKDLTNQIFGRLTAIKYLGTYKWECKCECGTITIKNHCHLLSGGTKSCGCLVADNCGLHPTDLATKVFGRLTVIEQAGHKGNRVQWLCKCECGNTTRVTTNNLTSGGTKSCGCLALEMHTKHGYLKNGRPFSEYWTWVAMKYRCTNNEAQYYDCYGGRGITVCDRWKDSFANFIQDMGMKPSPELSLDRIDNDKGYSPENCRWATQSEQNINRRGCGVIKRDAC